jgi:predicted ATPase
VAAVYTRARDLCRSLGETPYLAPVLQGLRLHHLLRAELQPAQKAAGELFALGERTQDRGQLLEGHRAVGVMSFYYGSYLAAREHFLKGITLYDAEVHGAHALRYEHDPGATCLAYAARTLWVLGYPNQAAKLADEAITVARATSHVPSVVEATTWRAEIALSRQEFRSARELAAAALARATEHGLPLWTGLAAAMHGLNSCREGQSADGIAQIRDGLVMLADNKLWYLYGLGMLAEGLGRGGQPQQALAALDEALEIAQASEVSYWDAALHRLKGELIPAKNGADSFAAEACFYKAIEIAQAQSARSLELRAATSLARLWLDQGKRAEAHDLLTPVYGWFTEGLETADLKDARALLDQLG